MWVTGRIYQQRHKRNRGTCLGLGTDCSLDTVVLGTQASAGLLPTPSSCQRGWGAQDAAEMGQALPEGCLEG